MKHIIFILSTILSITSCAQNHDFKYQGEMPSYSFNQLVVINNDITTKLITTDSVQPRNRIYIEIDSSNENILLNSHIVPPEKFQTSFEFVFTNPKNLNHLPESIEKAVIYLDGYFPLRENEKYQIAVDTISNRIIDVLLNIYFEKYPNEKEKSFEEINKIDFNSFFKNLNFYFVEIEEMFSSLNNDMNEGLPVKIDTTGSYEKYQNRKRNILHVLVNKNNQIFARNKQIQLNELKVLVKEFIANPNKKPEYAINPKQAIISLQNDRDTNYETYLAVYNILKAAYDELWDEEAQSQFNKNYDDLNTEQQKRIKAKIPLVISEAEPID